VFPDLLREIAVSDAFSKVYEPRVRKVYALPDLKSAQRPQVAPATEVTASIVH
jgi:hypothetical protein